MERKQNDKQLVLEYLRENKTITPLEALNTFGCYRLGARIYDLRRDGHTITTTLVYQTDYYGNPMRYAKYMLVQEKT